MAVARHVRDQGQLDSQFVPRRRSWRRTVAYSGIALVVQTAMPAVAISRGPTQQAVEDLHAFAAVPRLRRLAARPEMQHGLTPQVIIARASFTRRQWRRKLSKIAFVTVLYGALRTAVQGWDSSLASFKLREDLFQDMAVAHTYKNSVWPWIQTGGVALAAAILIIFGVKWFTKSMKEWELRQEMLEMNKLGEDALFLASTPVDATPLEKSKRRVSRKKTSLPLRAVGKIADWTMLLRVGACVGYLLPLLNVLDFGEISVSLYPYALGVPPSEPIVDFMQNTLKLKFLYNAYLKSGYYFLIVWFIFIQVAVRNKSAPFYVRFHSSQAILISMLLGVPQQVFFAVLNPWESGLVVQSFMYYSMVSLFLFILVLVMWCCIKALLKKTMKLPLVSEAAVMWAGKE